MTTLPEELRKIAQIADVEVLIRATLEYCRPWMRHNENCTLMRPITWRSVEYRCDCGLSALIPDAPSATPPEETP